VRGKGFQTPDPLPLTLYIFCPNEPCHVVFHHRFAALIFHPLTISNDTAAARRHGFFVEHFDFDLDRIVYLDGSEQAHLIQTREGHSGSVDQSGLHSESFGHAERQTAGSDALAVESLRANKFEIQEQWFGEADQVNKRKNVMFGDRAPRGGVALAGLKFFKGFAALHSVHFLLLPLILTFSRKVRRNRTTSHPC